MTDSCCGTELELSALKAQQKRVLVWVLIINVVTFLMMVGGALVSGSSSLLSGTLDNLGDALTYAVSLAVVGASCAAKARVALLKGIFISGAAIAVAAQIGWRVLHPETPLVEPMGVVAILNLGANSLCLWLLSPHRESDINMNSVWECSRNDVVEGFAVIGAALAVWMFDSGWPDILVAVALLVMFSRSAGRVLSGAWRELKIVSA
ncbi:MAG: cation transporter [Woeseiaceae bacterium]